MIKKRLYKTVRVGNKVKNYYAPEGESRLKEFMIHLDFKSAYDAVREICDVVGCDFDKVIKAINLTVKDPEPGEIHNRLMRLEKVHGDTKTVIKKKKRK